MSGAPTLRETSYPELGHLYRGKVRDSYVAGTRRYLIATDRISAFDVVFDACIPFKGRVLNEITAHFTELARAVVPCAFESRPHPCVIVAREAPTYPIEVVVRGHLCGSAWQAYARGEREVSGVRLPEGLRQNQRFDTPIITPSTKAAEGHDLPISRDELLARGIVPEGVWREIERMALILFAHGTEAAAERGLVLLDTKYEFGAGEDGPVLIDEVHTPDSSRYVRRAAFERDPEHAEPLSKEFLRDWLRARGFTGQAGAAIPALTAEIVDEVSRRYLALCAELTGRALDTTAGDGDLHREIFEALRAAGHLRGFVALVLAEPGPGAAAGGAGRAVCDALAALGVPTALRPARGAAEPAALEALVRWADRYPGEVVWVDATGDAATGARVAAYTRRPLFRLGAGGEAGGGTSMSAPDALAAAVARVFAQRGGGA